MAWDKPSVPVILYLSAHRLLPNGSVGHWGTHIPCSGVRVQTEALALALFVGTFWSLKRQGLIDIEIIEAPRPRWVLHHDELSLALLERRERPGLEGAIITNLENRASIRDVISRWAVSGSADPWHDVIGETVKEAIAEGLIRETETESGLLTKLVGSDRVLEPDCRRIRSMSQRFNTVAASWKQFQTQEKPLYHQLHDQCRKALIACSECWIV